MKTRKLNIAGLHLWQVSCSYKGTFNRNENMTLLITTPTNSVKRAIAKAEQVLKRDRWLFPQGRVEGVSKQGNLDA